MHGPSVCSSTSRHKAEAGPRPQGFSLLEMTMVVTLISKAFSFQLPGFSESLRRETER